MPVYSFFALLLLGSLGAMLIRFFLMRRRKDIPEQLFLIALKNENSGHFEAAVIEYKIALEEVKKFRFHNRLKRRIAEKLKVLNTIIKYNNNLHFTRYTNGSRPARELPF